MTLNKPLRTIVKVAWIAVCIILLALLVVGAEPEDWIFSSILLYWLTFPLSVVYFGANRKSIWHGLAKWLRIDNGRDTAASHAKCPSAHASISACSRAFPSAHSRLT